MSRERITSRELAAHKELEALEREFDAADGDKVLETEAGAAAKEEKQTVSESVPAGKPALKDQGDQNAKANKNWPISASEKLMIAKKMVKLAKDLLAD